MTTKLEAAELIADLENGAQWCEERPFRDVMRRAAAYLAALAAPEREASGEWSKLIDPICKTMEVAATFDQFYLQKKPSELAQLLRKMASVADRAALHPAPPSDAAKEG